MLVSLAAGLGIAMAGCVTTEPVDKPCGVIVDSLKDVHATTGTGDVRISKHYARGKAAHCWL